MTWYTVSSNRVVFQGIGTINGEGIFTFRVEVADGDPVGQADHLDIQIWEGTDTVSAPFHRSKGDLAGGNIVAHMN